MSTTLVVGGAGLVGSHLVPKLLDTGRRVTVVGRASSPFHPLPKEAAYISGDFGDIKLIRALLDGHEEVIHLAYATVPNTSFDNPLVDLLQNLPPTVQLFAEVAARGGKLLLVSSGGTIYGEAISLPVLENHPTQPISPYGVTKLTLEKYAHLYSVTHGLQVVCLRPSNAYGEGQRPYVGQGFIATAMASVMQGKPITLFGRYGVVRDYVYVSDLADGIFKALESGMPGEVYNVGSGFGRSNLDVIEAMIPLMRDIGCVTHIDYAPERVFDVRSNILDSSKLRQHTGWVPQVSFEEGLLHTRDWLSSFLGH